MEKTEIIRQSEDEKISFRATLKKIFGTEEPEMEESSSAKNTIQAANDLSEEAKKLLLKTMDTTDRLGNSLFAYPDRKSNRKTKKKLDEGLPQINVSSVEKGKQINTREVTKQEEIEKGSDRERL